MSLDDILSGRNRSRNLRPLSYQTKSKDVDVSAHSPTTVASSATPSSRLRKSAHAFATAFASADLQPRRFVDRFLTHAGAGPTIIEHAPAYANKPLPYTNKTFQGRDEAIQFLSLRLETLKTNWFDGAVPADECIVVDPECMLDKNKSDLKGSACVVCQVQTEHVESGWKWNETLIYKLTGVDDDGRFARWVSSKPARKS
jgi:hypothetical protein